MLRELNFLTPLATIGFTANNGNMDDAPDHNRTPDEVDREKFYTTDNSVDGDDDEYELEAPDAEVIASQKRLAEENIAAVESRIDVDELLRGEERYSHEQWISDSLKGDRFRFQTKHLLMVTALLAIYLTIGQSFGFLLATFLYFVVGVSTSLYYLNRKDEEHAAKFAKRKQELRNKLRKGSPLPSGETPQPNKVDATLNDALGEAIKQGREFRFSFSLKHMMMAVTIAVVVLGLSQILGGYFTFLLGVVAGVGLGVHVAGFEPPELVVMGWWVVLAVYVLMSIGGIFMAGFAT